MNKTRNAFSSNDELPQLMSKLYQSKHLIQSNKVLEEFAQNVKSLFSSKELEFYIVKMTFFG